MPGVPTFFKPHRRVRLATSTRAQLTSARRRRSSFRRMVLPQPASLEIASRCLLAHAGSMSTSISPLVLPVVRLMLITMTITTTFRRIGLIGARGPPSFSSQRGCNGAMLRAKRYRSSMCLDIRPVVIVVTEEEADALLQRLTEALDADSVIVSHTPVPVAESNHFHAPALPVSRCVVHNLAQCFCLPCWTRRAIYCARRYSFGGLVCGRC